MKVAAIIEYAQDEEMVKSSFTAQREYLRGFLENGQLFAAFAEDAGALWILDAETIAAAEAIVKGDPHVAAGVIAKWEMRPLAYWSAKEAKGAK